jgi:hypothetical protein
MCRWQRPCSTATTIRTSDGLKWSAETSAECSNAGLDGFILLLEVVKETSDSILPLKAIAAGALAIIQLSRVSTLFFTLPQIQELNLVNHQNYKSNRKEWIRFANLVAEHVAVILRRVSDIPKDSVSLSLSEDVMALLRYIEALSVATFITVRAELCIRFTS